MDVQTGLVCAGVFVLSVVVIFVVSMFGIKEKTYEEAIAEQRNMPAENLLLGRSGKDKTKDKKQKKAGKKVKEKPTEQEKKQSEAVLSASTQPTSQEKTHVDFNEPEAEVVSERLPQGDKKKNKKEKVKPILLNKDEESLVAESLPVPANHFEVIQPKDDLLLKQKGSKGDLIDKGGDTAFVETVVGPPSAPEKAPSKQSTVKADKKAEKLAATTVQQEQATPPPPSKERNKKKRSELATLQQMSGDREGVNVSLLVPLVRKAELSRSEIQILIDLLLNKQQGSAVGSSEWIEVSGFCVSCGQAQLNEDHQLLRKLQDEQGQAQGVLEQELHNQRQQLELHIAHLNETNQEAEAAFKSQIGQLHGELQEQGNINATLSGELQKLRDGRDGEIKMLREQISHCENQIRHLESQAAHLKESTDQAQELVRQNEELHRIKTELEHLVANSRQHEAALQYEYKNLQEELEALKEKCASYNEIKSEVSHLRSENEQLLAQVIKVKDLQAETQHLHEENEHLVSQIASFSQLEKEAQQLREENESLAAQVTAMTERPAAEGRENGDLHDPEEKQADTKERVSEEDSIVKQKELLLEKFNDELKQKDSVIEKLNSDINTCKTEISKLNEDLELQRRKNNDLRTKNWKAMEALSVTEKSLESKVKESTILVSEVSKKVRTEEQAATKELLQRIFRDIRIEDHTAYDLWVERFESSATSFISQLKTRQPAADSVSEDHSSMLIELEKQNSQLQTMVTHYKTIIEETEGMLNKLQNHVEQEEERWRQQMQIMEAELETIRDEKDQLQQSLEKLQRTEEATSEVCGVEFAFSCIQKSLPCIMSEMQLNLQDLEEKLQVQEAEKRELVLKYEEIQNSCDRLKDQVNSNEQHEEKEKERLTLELKTEKDKNQDLVKEMVKLHNLVQLGEDSLSQEQQLVQQLQQQLDKLNGANQNHSVATNGPAPEPSINESLTTSPQPLSETSMLEKRPKIKKKKVGDGMKFPPTSKLFAL
ncbi:ribosome-binding protein 1 [Zootermopsis nevadensis]|uniref:ribosome-binding protein 1 n=1 Tax=Zootermopsis nevadensis TaxID=136037 RepID=UPI000B8E85E1|nr:ribosome-binding protein 1 [Zootermopsis nevadensis]